MSRAEALLLFRAEERLLAWESRVALLDRMRPRNFQSELERLVRDLERGRRATLEFSYELPARVEGARSSLEGERASLERGGASRPLAGLLAERASELLLELELVEERGGPRVVEKSARRYAFEPGELAAAEELAEDWLADAEEAFVEEERAPLFEALRLDPRVEASGVTLREADIPSLAAAARGVLLVQRGARVSPRERERLVVHELGAHLLPRVQAEKEGPPFRIGTAGASADEEGRAVLLEERAGLLDVGRRRELAARYFAARWLREGATVAEVGARLLDKRIEGARAARALARAARGGGLAREIVYLAGYVRVKAALAREPELEDWMRGGRISVQGARVLALAQRG